MNTNLTIISLAIAAAAVGGCSSKAQGPICPCTEYSVSKHKFKYRSQQARVEVKWHEEWTSRFGETLPKPLAPAQHWQHPKLSNRYAAAMHEDSLSTDVSALPGPTPNNPRVEYFHVLEKGKRLSGMAPLFTFLDDTTLVTISFGRDAATLLVVDVTDDAKVLDQVDIPGRGSSMLELAKKRGRIAIFRDTSGGAYSYLDTNGDVYVPGHNNTVIRIPIRNRRIQRKQMLRIDLKHQIGVGSLEEAAQQKKGNRLTAIFPGTKGRIWFTSKYGVVGIIDTQDKTGQGCEGIRDDCPRTHATAIQYFAAEEKIRQKFGDPPAEMERILALIEEGREDIDRFPELRREFRNAFHPDKKLSEQIQNSFSVGPDGVYIITNFALYKLIYDEEDKRIELDPAWKPTYALGDLMYDNDHKIKPGHLNDGSGTTPTLIGDDFVAIVDNGPEQVHLNVFRQKDGTLVSKLPMFEPGKGAVENSVVAYGKHLIVGNTYGYKDPFKVNDTAGGIMRFDFDEASGQYVQVKDWPATGHFDAKTATPKLTTANGLIYVYHRDEEPVNGHHDWQITTLDFRTGLRVFSIKGYFGKGEFKENLIRLVRKSSLGTKNYSRKVFNNIWGTFSFAPGNSLYIGAYRGFLRFSSE